MLKFRLAVMVAIGLLARMAVGDVVVQNAGFELPTMTNWNSETGLCDEGFWSSSNEYYFYNTTDATPLAVPGWTLSDVTNGGTAPCVMAGILRAGAWGTTMHGDHAMVVGGGGGGWFSQNVTGFTDGKATLSFYGSGYNAASAVQVMMDGTTPLMFGVSSTVSLGADNSTLVKYTSNEFDVTAGSHLFQFNVTHTGNFDDISITQTPEPSSFLLLASGLIGLFAYAWRKRK